MTDQSIFSREFQVVQEAESLLNSSDFSDDSLLEPYADLLKHYKKLFRQTKRLVKMSDRMQHNLNDLNLELQRHKEILSQLSYVDGLTTIANRRRFNEYLEQEWKRGIRSGRPLALIILDIDHFKQFNDHYGHSSGDECLVKVARVLSSSVKRSCDLLARYGGEEFAVILPETQFSGARSVASAIKDDIQEAAIPHGYSPVASVLTVSIGLTARVPDGQYSSRYLIEAADRQLYAAKEAGRNQIQG